MKNFGEKEAWAYPGTAHFWVPATDFKFGQYIQRVHPNESPLTILEERGVSRHCPIFFAYPRLSQERVKLRNSNFACTFIGSIKTKAHKKSGKVAVGVVRDSRKFSGLPYIHVRRIARSSLR